MFYLAESSGLNWVTNAIVNFFMWIINWFIETFTWTIDSILSFIPDSWIAQVDTSLAVVQPYFAIVNYWVPLSWAFAFLGGYVSFVLMMIGVKLFVKLFIPTVG